MIVTVSLDGCHGESWADFDVTPEEFGLLQRMQEKFGTKRGCNPGFQVEVKRP